jgi:hypothetical protein
MLGPPNALRAFRADRVVRCECRITFVAAAPRRTEQVLITPDAAELQSFALSVLPTLRLGNGQYCYERPFEGAPTGRSARYGIMVRLGLQRAVASGTISDPAALASVEPRRPTPDELTLGDHGLLLWSDARAGDLARIAEGVEHLSEELRVPHRLAPLEGMEVAWLAIGLAHAIEAPGAAEALSVVFGHLDSRRSASGLYRHVAHRSLRRELPNFATEVYTLLALAAVARSGAHDAEPPAITLADRLLELQRADGAWPWMFDAQRGTVVEEYEVYSVHQDAMAPMALFALAELTNRPEYACAAVRGVSYGFGRNELGISFYDDGAAFAHRSIRRRKPYDRAVLAANAVTTRALGRAMPGRISAALELNRTCRPYHLGWILEAWSGREEFAQLLLSTAAPQ